MREYRAEHLRQSCVNQAVFEENEYFIVNINDCGIFLTPFTSTYKSLILHRCSSTKGVYNYTSRMNQTDGGKDGWADQQALTILNAFRKCGLCKTAIPDSVQTLWTLQNADTLSQDYDVSEPIPSGLL